jgi:hypothetical protein
MKKTVLPQRKRNKLLQFFATQQEEYEYKSTAQSIDISFSQLVRHALREKIAELKRTHPALREQENKEVSAI